MHLFLEFHQASRQPWMLCQSHAWTMEWLFSLVRTVSGTLCVQGEGGSSEVGIVQLPPRYNPAEDSKRRSSPKPSLDNTGFETSMDTEGCGLVGP